MNTTSKTKAFALALSAVCALQSFAAETSLPAGYTRLEWIAAGGGSDGSQFLDTGYTPSSTDKISLRFREPAKQSSSDKWESLFCARTTSTPKNTFTVFHNDKTGQLRFDFGTKDTAATSPALGRNADHILEFDGNAQTYTLDGATSGALTDVSGAPFAAAGSSIHLFSTQTGSLVSRFRIYWFQVRDSAGALTADLRPCKRDSDGAVGMFDLVRETFCPAGGTGTFDTHDTKLPSGYSAREWIQSSGTQWINTEFTPFCFDSVTTTFRFKEIPSGANVNLAVFCARKDGKQTFSLLRIGSTFRFDHNAGKMTVASTVSPVVNTDYTITMNGTTLVGTVNGGNDVAFNDAGNFTVGSPFVLFAAHGGTISDANMTMKSSLRLFSFTVTDSATGTVLCDLLPCVRSLDNEAGLYDRINKRFLTNGGTGEFKVPIYSTFITFR